MRSFKSDTSTGSNDVLIEGYQRMSPREKMRLVNGLNCAVHNLALARIRKQYGDLPEHELRLRLASLRLDREIMTRLFGWDPAEKGF